jgi:hypothetical protein
MSCGIDTWYRAITAAVAGSGEDAATAAAEGAAPTTRDATQTKIAGTRHTRRDARGIRTAP